jgi:negative regulator of flagellin synthesis FlgM
MSITRVTGQEQLPVTSSISAAASVRANAYRSSTTTSVARQPDAVSLSDQARSLASAIKKVSGTPEVREDRVAAIRAALANGTYQVSSRDLASSLLAKL